MRPRRQSPSALAGPALAAALAAAPSLAAAADWWVTGEGVDGSRSMSDAASRRCVDGRCSIWERNLPSADQPGAKVVDSLAEYDCPAGRTATRAEATYGPGMKQLSLVRASQLSWYPVESGTVGQRTLLFACNADKDRLSAGHGHGVEIDGQTFVREATAQAPPPSVADEAASTPSSAPPPPRPDPAATGSGGAQLAQLGALASWTAARAVLDTLQTSDPQLLSGLTTRVDTVVVEGRKVFRAIVAGLPSPAAAESFCRTVRGAGRPCLVRADPAR